MPNRIPALLLALLAPVLLAGCSSDGSGSDVEPGATIPTSEAGGTPSPGHVHGLARDPGDGRLLVATHQGLWQAPEDGDELELASDHLHDFMGFSVVGEDHYLASGHPNGADLPSHMGLIETTDGGETWRSVALMGEADFHVLRAGADATLGWNSTSGRLMAATGDRTDWQVRGEEIGILDLAIAPDDPDTLLAAIPVSETELSLQRSSDGGESFEPIEDAPALARLAWPSVDEAWGFDPEGGVWRSDDEGSSWERTGSVEQLPQATWAGEDELLAALDDGVHGSTDGGRSWERLVSLTGS